MLGALDASGLLEVVAVVTRYFGGVKLGTGGLVRAYGGAVREGLRGLPTMERVLHHVVRVVVDYAAYGGLRHLLPRYGARVIDASFSDKASLEMAVPYDRWNEVTSLVQEVTNGRTLLGENRLGDRYYPDPGKE